MPGTAGLVLGARGGERAALVSGEGGGPGLAGGGEGAGARGVAEGGLLPARPCGAASGLAGTGRGLLRPLGAGLGKVGGFTERDASGRRRRQ
ncbi:hypothetical protein [Streptomyces sp. CBMA156]|uniref:hypothetical protein n=1 Tax=Streptomyces sp. CBMA156 TaxID=1930280 RepID=UPI001661AC8C|nr:hypothetical protein [Streptomyces sp. CBMA156]MBD0673617.1 hypothetical protein [Streptomyces sp. CBMA156]